MQEDYVSNLERENEQLRGRVVVSEEEAERVWGILDAVKDKIKQNPNMSIKLSTNFRELNTDRSGKLFYCPKKDIDDHLLTLDSIEFFYKKLLALVEEKEDD